ncbi:hypothetical protein Y032_0080g1384 [Ancylostoma ceylanicum]|uniref:Uncharacterized protein n=1 Tax=Ancylostoma ceylanicum TaxID=53326 RepID=A0A016TT45_9BILA|nr:hypothetical protein Y032_0080g1384 [Ancylostoma ceylanicum]
MKKLDEQVAHKVNHYQIRNAQGSLYSGSSLRVLPGPHVPKSYAVGASRFSNEIVAKYMTGKSVLFQGWSEHQNWLF